MLTESLILIEGHNVNLETLRTISFTCAKQLIVGSDNTFGVMLSVAAESPEYLRNALIDLSKVSEVTGVILLATRNTK